MDYPREGETNRTWDYRATRRPGRAAREGTGAEGTGAKGTLHRGAGEGCRQPEGERMDYA